MLRQVKQIHSLLSRGLRTRACLIVLMSLLSPALDLISLSMLPPILYGAASGGPVQEAALKLLLLGSLMVLKGGYELLLAKVQASWQCDCNQFLATEMYDMLLKEDLLRHNAKNGSQAVHDVRQDVGDAILALAAFKELLLNGILLAGYMALVFVLSGIVGVACVLTLGALLLLLCVWHMKRAKACGKEVRQQEIALADMALSAYHAYKEVAIDADKAPLTARFSRAAQKKEAITKSYLLQQAAMTVALQNLSSAVIFLLLAAVLLSGFAVSKLISMAVLLVAVLAKMMPAARGVLLNGSHIHYAASACNSVYGNCRYYRALPAREHAQGEGGYRPLSLSQALVVRDITFAYPDGPAILEHAGMEIPAGMAVALVGPSGEGKTTLLDLITGLLVPQSGAILYDGCDIVSGRGSQAPCNADIGALVSYMPQAPAYWEGTVRACVAYRSADGNIDEGWVVECLKDAMLYEDIQKLPQGIDTVIGARGIRLSGGQYQRLGLARALYKDFCLLVMDEGTASLDEEMEAAVFQALRSARNGKTLLLATHHRALADRCDRVYEVKDRQIIRRK